MTSPSFDRSHVAPPSSRDLAITRALLGVLDHAIHAGDAAAAADVADQLAEHTRRADGAAARPRP